MKFVPMIIGGSNGIILRECPCHVVVLHGNTGMPSRYQRLLHFMAAYIDGPALMFYPLMRGPTRYLPLGGWYPVVAPVR